MGAYDLNFLELFAKVLQELGGERAMIVCGGDGLDEITLTGVTQVCELKEGALKRYALVRRTWALPDVPPPI
ncbi:MAG: hypothetical protein U1F57_08660 [bacterium]